MIVYVEDVSMLVHITCSKESFNRELETINPAAYRQDSRADCSMSGGLLARWLCGIAFDPAPYSIDVMQAANDIHYSRKLY